MKKILISLTAVFLLFSMAFMAACGNNAPKIGESGYREINSPDMIEFVNWNVWTVATGSAPNQIIVHSDNEDMTFTCTVERGEFFSRPQGVKQQVIGAGERAIYYPEEYPIRQDFMDIIVQDGEHIVGYAVIKITETAKCTFSPKLLKSILFPRIDGKHQAVEREKVEEVIENIKIRNS